MLKKEIRNTSGYVLKGNAFVRNTDAIYYPLTYSLLLMSRVSVISQLHKQKHRPIYNANRKILKLYKNTGKIYFLKKTSYYSYWSLRWRTQRKVALMFISGNYSPLRLIISCAFSFFSFFFLWSKRVCSITKHWH